MLHRVAATFVLALALAASAPAQVSADYKDAVIGGNVTFVMRASPGDVYLNVVSLSEGPTCFPPSQPVGCVDVDLNLLWISFLAPGFFGTMPGSGEVDATFGAPNDPLLDGFLLRDQLIKVVGGRLAEKSNLVRIMFSYADQWHDSVGTIQNERAEVPAIELDDGRILLAGGGGANLDQCEVYIPWLQEFAAVAPLHQGRVGHTVTKLADGKVLVAGGTDATPTVMASAEVYDPANDTWTTVGPLAGVGRVAHTANLLGDGRVLMCGGSTDLTDVLHAATSALKTTELYDPVAQTFSAGPALARPHTGQAAVVIGSGKVLVAGGATFTKVLGIPIPNISNAAQLFDPTSGTFGTEITLQAGRILPAAALLNDGRVLLAGGIGGPITAPVTLLTAEAFDPSTSLFSSVGSMSIARVAASTVRLPSAQTTLVAGGATNIDINNPAPTDVAELFDTFNNTFTLAAPLTVPRAGAGAILLKNNLAAFFGGVGIESPAALYRE